MPAHWINEQRQVAERFRDGGFETDDETLVHAANEHNDASTDLTSLMTVDVFTSRSPPILQPQRQILVIYEWGSPPTTTTIDPSMPISRYRHAIGDLMEVDRDTAEWDNFLIAPVRPRPPYLDPLTHESFIFIFPRQIRFGFVHLLVRFQLFWEYIECRRTDEYSQIRVVIFPQRLDRESFHGECTISWTLSSYRP